MKMKKSCNLCSSRNTIGVYKSYSYCRKCYNKNQKLKNHLDQWEHSKDHVSNKELDLNEIEFFLDQYFEEHTLNKKLSPKEKLIRDLMNHWQDMTQSEMEKFYSSKIESFQSLFESFTVKDLKELNKNKLNYKTYDEFSEYLLNRGSKQESKGKTYIGPTNKEIVEEFDKYIIGQEDAKKTFALALTDYYIRLQNPSLKKNNILISGPTGTGKTEFSRVISKKAQMPLVLADATSMTASGFVGHSPVDTIVKLLLAKSDDDIELAQKGIVFIDEIDKIAKHSENTDPVNSEQVQNELLKALDGDTVVVELGDRNKIEFSFANIIIVASGAFSEMYKEQNEGSPIGLNRNNDKKHSEDKSFKNLTNEDLRKYGFKSEFIGRFAHKTYTNKLTKNDLKKVLSDKKNSILDQYRIRFEVNGCHVNFSSSFINEIVEEAIECNTGARGLEEIVSKKLKNILYEIDSYEGKSISIMKGSKVKII